MTPEMTELQEALLCTRAQPCVPGRPLEHHGVWMPTAAWDRLENAVKDVLAGQPVRPIAAVGQQVIDFPDTQPDSE